MAVDNRGIAEQILTDMTKAVRDRGGDKILKIVLYGSRARGDYDV